MWCHKATKLALDIKGVIFLQNSFIKVIAWEPSLDWKSVCISRTFNFRFFLAKVAKNIQNLRQKRQCLNEL